MNHPERINTLRHRAAGFNLTRMGWGTLFAIAGVLFASLALIARKL